MAHPTIQHYFQDDHKRLDALLKQYRELKRTDPSKAKEAFAEFLVGLQRHIVWEEAILFPRWEQTTETREGGPTQVMRAEHRQISHWLEALHKKVQAQDPESEGEEQGLLALLTAHNQKEERILYPAIDRTLSEADRAALYEAMRAIPEAQYRRCCDTP